MLPPQARRPSSASAGDDGAHGGEGGAGARLVGHALLAAQCVCGAAYQLVQKALLDTSRYPPLSVAAWGYMHSATRPLSYYNIFNYYSV